MHIENGIQELKTGNCPVILREPYLEHTGILPTPHPSEFHQHCQHYPFGVLYSPLSVTLNQVRLNQAPQPSVTLNQAPQTPEC